jgi:hypothetical protein
MSAPILSIPSGNLSMAMPGIWWLLSREDWTKDGQLRIEPTLGNDPIAILTYGGGYFAAQFMKRNRSDDAANQIFYTAKNNSSAVGGYDAYFGTYEVNELTGEVAHTLIGSITPSNIGMTFMRNLRINNNRLTLQLETTTPEGESVIRTVIWNRIS